MEIKKKSPIFLGLGKTLFSSSVCVFDPELNEFPVTYLLERYSRKKADGSWPSVVLLDLMKEYGDRQFRISENRDVVRPIDFERALDNGFPFFDFLKKKKLEIFSSRFNEELTFLSHHYSHAQVAKYMSPFEKCVVLVIDGAGSKFSDIESTHLDYRKSKEQNKETYEESSVYTLIDGKLECKMKNGQEFFNSNEFPDHFYSEGIGTCYEKIAEFIFNSKRASGKVMGLAPFGKDLGYRNSLELLNSLNWQKSYRGKSKEDWESSEHMDLYKNLACTVQRLFEQRLESLLVDIKNQFPKMDSLIITGGCALNCTSNMKLLNKKIFSEVYIPPFPGDESIGLGCALHEYYKENEWEKFEHSKQQGYFGEERLYNKEIIREKFKDFKIIEPESIESFCAELIADGKIIGWFQGRSESGPRALGNRSILSRMDIKGRKDFLNESVKFRESFRPYGASVLFEKAHTYFEIPENFHNPYMSFAVRVRERYRNTFNEATHIDGTSRMQLVCKEQNEKYYSLIQEVGVLTGVDAILNTSMNVMGEPIVETIDDLIGFLKNSNVYGVAIGEIFIEKEGLK